MSFGYTHKGFTLIEIMMGIVLVSFVIITGFQALSFVGIAKIKLIEQSEIEKSAYYATELFFERIKIGGSIDYEEYWNRYAGDLTYEFGSFVTHTGFGNLGDLYYCMSTNGNSMGTNGCLEDFNSPANNYKNTQQGYGQYALQFIDHNADFDLSGDEDNDGDIQGDADDLYLGIGPEAFPMNQDVGELYLINAEKNERTYFRWKVSIDDFAPNDTDCKPIVAGEKAMEGEACLGTIQFLKLIGRDYGDDHDNEIITNNTDNDGIIDTWFVHPDFTPDASTPLADINTEDYWQNIFGDDIHVSKAHFYLSPYKDINGSWRDTSTGIRNAPSLQLQLTLEPSWKEKRKIQGSIPVSEIRTTIHLLDIDIR